MNSANKKLDNSKLNVSSRWLMNKVVYYHIFMLKSTCGYVIVIKNMSQMITLSNFLFSFP